MIKINVFKIKKGKVKTWQNWCKLLNSKYKKEAVTTLKQEGLTNESFSSFKVNNITYVIAMSIGQHLPVDSENSLNQKHRKVKKECLEYLKTADISYYLES